MSANPGGQGAAPPLPEGPARDARFRVVDHWTGMANFPVGDPQRRFEFFHRQMNEEVDSLECAARNLADFASAEWDLRLCLARQCADEARHARMFRRFFERAGGRVGQFPVISFQYRIVTAIPDLLGRLAVQNRSFEAGGIDAIAAEIANCRDDPAQCELFEAQLADEIAHVRFANEHINKAIRSDSRAVLAIGRALALASEAFAALMGNAATDGATHAADRQGRLEAGFRDDEIALAEAAAHKIRADEAARKRARDG
ncbi:MAG TPA: DUF455 family protein [Stellaceae bacterium]|nr:DUF455 family protein [Stellaceae bacterium]